MVAAGAPAGTARVGAGAPTRRGLIGLSLALVVLLACARPEAPGPESGLPVGAPETDPWLRAILSAYPFVRRGPDGAAQTLRLTRFGTFGLTSFDHLGRVATSRRGLWELTATGLELAAPPPARPSPEQGRDAGPEGAWSATLHLVLWGDRRYLIEPAQVEAFERARRLGEEPRNILDGPFFLDCEPQRIAPKADRIGFLRAPLGPPRWAF